MKLFSNLSITFKRCDGESCKKIFFPWDKPPIEKDGKIFCRSCFADVQYHDKMIQQMEQSRQKPRFITDNNPGLYSAINKLLDGHKPGTPVGKLIKGIQYGHSGSLTGSSGFSGSVTGYTGVSGKVNDDDVLHLKELIEKLATATNKTTPRKRRSK